MIELNAHVPTRILALDRHETFGDYARAYGDEITRVYEDDGLIYFPHFPLTLDLEYFQGLAFPLEWKKVGTINEIARDAFVRQGDRVLFDSAHPLFEIATEPTTVAYILEQMRAAHHAIFEGLARLLPHYHSLRLGNITWRCTESIDEGMHLDAFSQGKALGTDRDHRIKMFINIDTLPRHWQISYDVMTALERFQDRLPAELPDDLNLISAEMGRRNLWADAPYHTVKYPQLAAVLANGESVSHNLVFGRRVIGVELLCNSSDMLDPEKQPSRKLSKWLRQHRAP